MYQARWDMQLLQQALGLPRGFLPVGRAQKASKEGPESPHLAPLHTKQQQFNSEVPQDV